MLSNIHESAFATALGMAADAIQVYTNCSPVFRLNKLSQPHWQF